MANNDLNSIAQEVVLLSQELELAQKTNDWPEVDDILTRFKDAGEKALSLDESVSDKYFLYAMTTRPRFDFRSRQQDYRLAGDVILESLMNIQPLFRHLDEERPIVIICTHLQYFIDTVGKVFVEDFEDPSMKRKSWGDYGNYPEMFFNSRSELLSILCDLYVQCIDFLRLLSPANPMISQQDAFLSILDKAGLVGNTKCKLNNIAEYLENIKSYWETIRPPKYDEIDINPFDTSIPDDDSCVDLFQETLEDYDINYDNLYNNIESLETMFPGLKLVANFNEFIVNYVEYCNRNQIIPFYCYGIDIKECVPYCPAMVAMKYSTIARRCFLLLHDELGMSRKELIDLICDDNGFLDYDTVLDYAEKSKDLLMQSIIVSLVSTDFETEGILLENKKLELSLFGEINYDDDIEVIHEHFEDIDEEAIENKMNEYKEALMKCNCLTKR